MSILLVPRPENPVKNTRKGRTRSFFLTSIVSAVTFSAALVAVPEVGMLYTTPAHAQNVPGPAGFADVAEKVRPAVVSIFTKSTEAETPHPNIPEVPEDNPFHDFFERYRKHAPQEMPRLERAQGSGFLISADGYVVTNHHVIDKATEISVSFDNDEKFDAKLIGSDERTDIALLKIEGDHKFPFLEFASDTPRVGDWVLAVGNPFGFGGTVTAGIVSAGARSISKGPYDYLQIDAAVNRGNSGGPSVNLKGQVIGVNTAIYSPSGGNVGIAFAIPSNLVKSVVEQLKSSGKVSRGWLGVSIQDVNKEIAESLGLKTAKGALITKIMPDGPSAKSDLKMRDVVIEVNAQKIENSRDLARKIAEIAPNSDASLLVIRDGKEKAISVKLGTFPTGEKLAALESDGATPENQMKELGLTLAPARELQGAGEEGVAITNVDPRSEAADKGLKPGDVILDVGGKTVATPADVLEGIKEAKNKGRKAVLMQVLANRQARYIALSLEKKK
jgi:serine protease Do